MQRASDPFQGGAGSSVIYEEGLNVAHPSRVASPGSASQARTAPALSASRNSGQTGGVSSAYSKGSYPWYLQTRYIIGLIILLLLALGLGLGLGLGLNSNKNNSASSAADNAGNASTVSVQSTATAYINGTDSVTIVPSIISNSVAGTSVVLQTVGGATVTAPVVTVSAATTQVMITVSETVDPSTSTQIATRTVVAGTTTFTSVIGGGETATITRTIFNTVTGAANRVRARRLGNEGLTFVGNKSLD